MSDMSFEAPDADTEEQHQDAVPAEAEDDEAVVESGESGQTPLEANDADRAEQRRIVSADDDEYR